ncbi:hypothetical protein EAD89_12795 [Micromonospora sp. BL4]|uniref:hypothetical protein n=1 Tax=Micromonospora sp. BL4 TaxID=2478710 RepID=UPI000F2C0842|nr:hypothetical protein [Micromonospora sp. BL4]RLP90940.1 hypothetical protein EAD89_12795 [Micromonospora sp. BL4]
MPAPVAPDARRQPPLLTMLFWAGVALAPVAALILLVADGNGPLRFAAVLAILAVVLIGLSIALRPDGEDASARADELLDEIEELRRELRAEIVAAAQRGNQALDQAQRAQEGVIAVRRRLDASGAALAGAAPAEPAGAGRARVPVGEPVDEVPVARSRVSVPGDAPAGRGRVSPPEHAGARRGHPERADDDEPPYQAAPDAEPPVSGGFYGAEQPAAGYGTERPAAAYGTERPAAAYGAARPAAGYGSVPRPREHDRPEAAHRQVGVVRHTETVHVTTRHTVVDGGPAEPGGRYGGGYAGQWSPPAQEWTRGGAEERSRGAQAATRDEPGWTARRDEPEWDDPRDAYAQPDDRGWSKQREPDLATAESQPGPALRADDTGEYWSQLRAGDRWAAVRDDDNGREMRVGERHAEVHADATGTEYRMADRWASVRHEDPRRHEDARRYDEPRRYDEREPYHRDEPARRHDRGGGWRDEPADRPALPVGGVPVPDEWRPPRQRGHQAEPVPERAGRRRVDERYGYPPQDDVPRAGGAPADDRWR